MARIWFRRLKSLQSLGPCPLCWRKPQSKSGTAPHRAHHATVVCLPQSDQLLTYLQITALGPATITVVRNSQAITSGTLQIDRVAPGLFAMNRQRPGRACRAGDLREGGRIADLAVRIQTLGACRALASRCPLDLGAATDQVFLQLYGTGIRGRTSLSASTAKIGGVDAPVEYAAWCRAWLGWTDKPAVPRSLIGRGELDVVLTVDGKTANTVRVNIK